MEYLEGETLAQRLVKGPLPIEQVLQYAIRDCRRAGQGAPQRRDPPRFEARQHHADQDGAEAAGFWFGEAEAASRCFGCHSHSVA